MEAKRNDISQEMLPEELETVSAGIGAAAQGDAALIEQTRNAKASGISLEEYLASFPKPASTADFALISLAKKCWDRV